MYSFAEHNKSNNSDLDGGLVKGSPEQVKSRLESFRGYYLLGDSLVIRQATERDIELKETYAIEIVSHFHNIIKPLIHLVERTDEEEHTTNSTITYVYYAMLGKVVLGKIEIMVQDILIRKKLHFIYYYKDSGTGKRRELHQQITQAKINTTKDKTLARRRKRRSLKMEKYKEK